MRRITIPSVVFLALALSAGAALATTHTVTQVNLTFSPSSITIEKGDTVVWQWTSGPHTVTSGTGPSAADAGALFDAPLDGSHTTFQHTFNDAGTVPYYCTFHVSLGMTGTVIVHDPTPVEVATWGRIKALYRGTTD